MHDPSAYLCEGGQSRAFYRQYLRLSRDFAETILVRMGVEVEFYDPLIGEDVAKQFKSNTTLVMMKAPGSHGFEMPNVSAIARVCKERDI